MRTAGDIMTKNVITVKTETPLVEAVNILLKNRFNGLPVVADGLVVGIITEYDMITKGSSIHIPTLLKIFEKLNQKDHDSLKNELKQVLKMKVSDVMNADPLTLSEDTSIIAVVDTFTQHHKVNPIPILNTNNQLVGIISRSDILKFLGDKNLSFEANSEQQEIEKHIDKFIMDFERRFVLVSKTRTRFWLLVSILFALVGFAIAWFLILRVNL